MILQALYEFAQVEGLAEDLDFVQKPVHWLVYVSRGGQIQRIVSTRYQINVPGRKKPITRAKEYRIPRQTPRSGKNPPPDFLVDNALYVFGRAIGNVKASVAETAPARALAFRERVRACALDTSDAGAVAVLQLLESVASGSSPVALDSSTASSDLFAFVFADDGDLLVTDRPAVEAYWRRSRLAAQQDAVSSICLVTGRPSPIADKHPKLKNVPMPSPGDIALISFNKPAFLSYGWKEHENAHISTKASEACGNAINRLLDPSKQPAYRLKLSANTVVCFWASSHSGNEFSSFLSGLLDANPEAVKETYRSVWRGVPVAIPDAGRFYALTLSGAQGRATVRDWLESTVAAVAGNLAAHFADLDIVRNARPAEGKTPPPAFGLRSLLESLAFAGDSDKIPAPHIAQILDPALLGTPYPLSLLQRALERHRAEIASDSWTDSNRRDARAALIKAVLLRRRRLFPDFTHYPELTTTMDPLNTADAYLLGRLLAVLERLQSLAVNAKATIVDRYFGAASASPRTVFVRLLRNARHHSQKARDSAESAGLAFRLERLIDDLSSHFDVKRNSFPASLSLEHQGLFVLGYHQMRHWLWMNAEERRRWEELNPAAPRAYLWYSPKSTAAPQNNEIV